MAFAAQQLAFVACASGSPATRIRRLGRSDARAIKFRSDARASTTFFFRAVAPAAIPCVITPSRFGASSLVPGASTVRNAVLKTKVPGNTACQGLPPPKQAVVVGLASRSNVIDLWLLRASGPLGVDIKPDTRVIKQHGKRALNMVMHFRGRVRLRAVDREEPDFCNPGSELRGRR